MGYLCRKQELDSCRRITVRTPEDTGRVGKSKLIWLESVEEELKEMGVRNWRGTASSCRGNSGGQLWKRLRSTKVH
jgi:hypothetical protein